MGLKIEINFRSDGELWVRQLESEPFLGMKSKNVPMPKNSALSFDGTVLQITEDGEESQDSVITQTEDGFVQQNTEGKISLS